MCSYLKKTQKVKISKKSYRDILDVSYYYKENQPENYQSNITWLLKFSENVIFPIKQESDCIVSCATKETFCSLCGLKSEIKQLISQFNFFDKSGLLAFLEALS